LQNCLFIHFASKADKNVFYFVLFAIVVNKYRGIHRYQCKCRCMCFSLRMNSSFARFVCLLGECLPVGVSIYFNLVYTRIYDALLLDTILSDWKRRAASETCERNRMNKQILGKLHVRQNEIIQMDMEIVNIIYYCLPQLFDHFH